MLLEALGVFALFASAISVNKLILFSIPALAFVALRMFLGGALLVSYHLVRSPRFTRHQLKADFIVLNGIALFTTLIPSFLKAYGLKHMLSSKSAFIGSLDPFITVVYAWYLHGHVPTFRQMIGIFCAFGAVCLMLFTSSASEYTAGEWLIFSLPECAALSAVVLSRYGWMKAQTMLKANRYNPSELNGLIMLISSMYAGVLSWLWWPTWIDSLPTSGSFWLAVAYTVIIGNTIAYTLYGHLLKRASASFVSLTGLSVPLFVHLLGPLVVNEPLSPLFFVSMGLMITGATLFARDEV